MSAKHRMFHSFVIHAVPTQFNVGTVHPRVGIDQQTMQAVVLHSIGNHPHRVKLNPVPTASLLHSITFRTCLCGSEQADSSRIIANV